MIRVLLVEDDRSFAEACMIRLLKHRFDICYCPTAERAREALSGERFEIAIIDLMLPPSFHAEGLSLLRTLRQKYPTVQPLLMTQKSSGTTETVAEAMKLGAKYFFDKNSEVFFENLTATIQEMVRSMNQNIFISHGHNELLKLRLKDFIATRLNQIPVVLSEQPSQGLTVVEKLERVSEKCCFAVVLMTRDDELRGNGARARQNVVHEIGFFQGKYGRNRVVLLAERGVELFANISGIVRLEFEADHFEEVFEPLRTEIEAAFGGMTKTID